MRFGGAPAAFLAAAGFFAAVFLAADFGADFLAAVFFAGFLSAITSYLPRERPEPRPEPHRPPGPRQVRPTCRASAPLRLPCARRCGRGRDASARTRRACG